MKLAATLQLHLGGEYVAHIDIGDIHLATKVDSTGELDTFELNVTATSDAITAAFRDAINKATDQLDNTNEAPAEQRAPCAPCAHSLIRYTAGDYPTCAECEETLAGPECEQHKPVQHRDGKPPWCNDCGKP